MGVFERFLDKKANLGIFHVRLQPVTGCRRKWADITIAARWYAWGDALAFSVFFRCVVAMNRCLFSLSAVKI